MLNTQESELRGGNVHNAERSTYISWIEFDHPSRFVVDHQLFDNRIAVGIQEFFFCDWVCVVAILTPHVVLVPASAGGGDTFMPSVPHRPG